MSTLDRFPLVVSLAMFLAWAVPATAQAPPPQAPPSAQAPPSPQAPPSVQASPSPQAPPSRFPNVVGALRTTPGCLGVETGQTSSGRRVIFAWFESKKALVDWYYGDVHQNAIKTVFPKLVVERRPLPDLAEDAGPILTIVSVKFAEPPRPDGPPPRIVSIGIELYGPLPGGVAVGGRFAPAAVKVPGLREFTTEAAEAAR